MSKSSFAAYPLIMDKLAEYSRKLIEFTPCDYWIHESVVANHIGLPRGDEHGSEALTALLACMKKGYGGNERKNTKRSTGVNAVDLSDENNISRVSYQPWGR